ncbi:GIY-YIG nuclease family protein [Sphingomonas parva]|uniref:GIY-YIG nuclease family protein n=1 Tax=Sphingomonas parva TaxID=2555898 RepID=A0A4Y8ZW47_9SPHN|nr:GIY-YIG nuclease family protein [Sphingomonas parva]TFI58666.1 GIY-YIG nuclease family protein [Sphingomonas parva]
MQFVYVIQSISHPNRFYTGLTSDVHQRLEAHDAGRSPHTSKFKPWRLCSFHWFERQETATAIERYLKSGSGRSFATRHLR